MAGLVGQVQDPMLQKMISDVEAKIANDPEMKKSYDQIMVAGMQLLFNEKTHPEVDKYLDRIKGPEDVPPVISHGICKELSIIHNESKAQEPLRAIGPAGQSLMAMALQLVEKRNGIEITKPMLDECVLLLKDGILDLYKITPQVIEALKNRKSEGEAAPPAGPPTAQPPAPSPVPTGV